jgi:hypothetical protein
MSSDTSFLATGPAVYGFQTEGSNLTQGALVSGTATGLMGVCTGTNGAGVAGSGAGESPGVIGYGADTAPGVIGIGGGGPQLSAPPPGNAVGVYGQAGTGDSDGVQGLGSGSGVGVFGQGGAYGAGGVFTSASWAQLRLVPSTTPLRDNPVVLLGQPGDLYLYSEGGGSGTLSTTTLWLCLGTPTGWEYPVWAEVGLGPKTVSDNPPPPGKG